MNRIGVGQGSPGFTLLEMLAVLSVLSVVLLLAEPSLQQLLHTTRARLDAGRILTALNFARAESVSRGVPVSVCPRGESAELACGSDYRQGWLVFSDLSRDGEYAEDAGDQLLREFAPVQPRYRVLDRDGAAAVATVLTYLPSGVSRRNLTFLVCAPPGVSVAGWQVVLSRVGRARLARESPAESACGHA